MVREPAVAGQFYPGNKDTLSLELDQMLNAAPAVTIPGMIVGIAVPHAGYPYSGPTAAHAYRAIAGAGIKTVVLLGPTHHVPFQGFAAYAKGAWKTPLGNVNIDETLAAELIKQEPLIQDRPQAHRIEHSLEVQVPFLQKALKDFKIVPIMSCEPSFAELQKLARALAKVSAGRKVLFLASSDLYHGENYDECRRSDSLTLSYIAKLDPKGLYDALSAGKAAACGGNPIVALMLAVKELGADKAQVLYRTNSNDVTGERGGYCVGYAATVFYRSGSGQGSRDQGSKRANEDKDRLTAEEQAELLRIARSTLDSYIREHKTPPVEGKTDRLKEKRGAFVTLKEQGQLRGCIGYIEAVKPLYQTVQEMAISASTEDYRFTPVQPGELSKTDIEITVLTPLVRTRDPVKDIQLGKHGIVVKQGSRQGVFLPQVATETGWNVETFLSECCSGKAGLAPDAWKGKDCEVYVFTGQVFGEKEETTDEHR